MSPTPPQRTCSNVWRHFRLSQLAGGEARGPITAHKAQGGPHKEGSSSTKCPRFRGREAESQTHGMVPNFPLDSDPGRSAWTAASATRKTADDCNGAESRASTKRRGNRSGTRGPAGGAASTWPQAGRAGRAFAFLCKRSWPGLVVETATEGQPGLPLEPGFGNEWKAPRLPSRLIGSQNTPEGKCVQAVTSLVPAVTWPEVGPTRRVPPSQPQALGQLQVAQRWGRMLPFSILFSDALASRGLVDLQRLRLPGLAIPKRAKTPPCKRLSRTNRPAPVPWPPL